MGRQGRHLRDHDPPEGIGKADIAVVDGEAEGIGPHVQDLQTDLLHIYVIISNCRSPFNKESFK